MKNTTTKITEPDTERTLNEWKRKPQSKLQLQTIRTKTPETDGDGMNKRWEQMETNLRKQGATNCRPWRVRCTQLRRTVHLQQAVRNSEPPPTGDCTATKGKHRGKLQRIGGTLRAWRAPSSEKDWLFGNSCGARGRSGVPTPRHDRFWWESSLSTPRPH